MKKLILIFCLIALLVVSLCACSFTADNTAVNTLTEYSVGIRNASHGLNIKSDHKNFMTPKPTSAGVFPGKSVRVDVRIGSNTFNFAITAKCYYKITSRSGDSTTYLIFYVFYINGYEITNYFSAGGYNRYYIGTNDLYKDIYIPGSANHLSVANITLFMAYRYYTEEGISTTPFSGGDNLTLTLKNSINVNFAYLDGNGNKVSKTNTYEYGAQIVADFELPLLEYSVFVTWNQQPFGIATKFIIFTAEYIYKKFNIIYYDYSNKELSREQRAAYSILSPVLEPPDVPGLAFIGWSTEYFNKDKIINTSSYKVMSDMSLYATYSGGSVMPGPGQNNPLYKECEWWDFGQHLINFVGWLLFDMPIIKDVVALIYSLISFFITMFGFLGVFAPMGFVGTLIIGIFGLFFLFKAIF